MAIVLWFVGLLALLMAALAASARARAHPGDAVARNVLAIAEAARAGVRVGQAAGRSGEETR